MSFLDRLRKMLAGPPHIQSGGAEGAEALHEEYGSPEEGAADLRRLGQTAAGGGAVMPGYGAAEAAGAAEAELEPEEAPPDPNP